MTRTTTILGIICLMVMPIYSQTTEELFTDDNPIYTQILEDAVVGYLENVSHFYLKEIMIDGRRYHQFIKAAYRHANPEPQFYIYYYFEGFKVFYIKDTSPESFLNRTLAFDFGLDVNDEFIDSLDNVFIVQEKNTIDLGDGINRIQLDLEPEYGTAIQWVEGIGNITPDSYTDNSLPYTLICKRDDTGSIFNLSEYSCESYGCPDPFVHFSYKTDTLKVEFINQSIRLDTFIWDFGDGNMSTAVSANHTYEKPGCYRVSLNGSNTCRRRRQVEFTSVCLDSSWMSQSNTNGIDGMFFLNDNFGWYFQGDQLYHSIDDGKTWVENFKLPTSPGMPERVITNVHFIDEQNGYLSSVMTTIYALPIGIGLYLTTDGGVSWTATQGTPINAYKISSTGTNELYCSGISDQYYGDADQDIFYSSDKGLTWEYKSTSEQPTYLGSEQISFLKGFEDGNILKIAAGTLGRSSDYGATFENREILPDSYFLKNHAYDAHFFNIESGFVLLRELGWREIIEIDDYKLLQTIDGGLNWEEIDLPKVGRLNDITFVDDDNGWISTEKGLLFRTRDGGLTWDYEYCVNKIPSNKLSASNSGSVYMSKSDGTISIYAPNENYECDRVLAQNIFDFDLEYVQNNTAHLNIDVLFNQSVDKVYVEHGMDTKTFQTIGSIDHTGSRRLQYQHDKLQTGQNYYRLYYFDENGRKEYSAIKQLTVEEGLSFTIAPNPFQDILSMEFNFDRDADLKIGLFTLDGKQINQKVFFGVKSISYNMDSRQLPAGVYILSMESNGISINRKVIKL